MRSWVPDQKPLHGLGDKVELSSIKYKEGARQGPVAASKLLVFTAHCGGYPMRVLLDSGAQSNFISAAAAQRASLQERRLQTPLHVRHSNGLEMEVTMEVPNVELVFRQSSMCVNAIKVAHLNYDIILGQPWHQQTNPEINWIKQQVWIRGTELLSQDGMQGSVPKQTGVAYNNVECKCAPYLEELVQEFADVFANDLPERKATGCTIQHHIDLEPGYTPPVRGLYRMSQSELQELKTILDDLLQKDFIAKSSSPFAAPILFVGKKDGSRRLCTDFRALNKITIKNRYPLPRIEDLQDCLYRAKVFSSIDLTSGYWQIPIRAEDQHKTAFRSRYGHYEWKVMPFGLCNAPATFQRFMNDIFRDLLDVCVVVYLDDILVFSRSKEEHQQHLRQVLQRLREHHLVAKPKKCVLGQESIEFLGHVIGNGSLEMSSEKIKAIQAWKTPFASLKEVRAFLGLASYYRRFIRNFAKIAAPISDLLQKNQELTWTEEANQAVMCLKEAITTAPVLQIADPTKPFVVTTDASGVAVGAVLEQEDADGRLHPIAFTSQKLRAEQRHYEVRDLELLAIVHALKIWRPYLLGQKVRVLTDHMPLESIQKREMDPSLKSRTLRAIEYLQAFDLDICNQRTLLQTPTFHECEDICYMDATPT